MTFPGHVKNGVVLLDDGATLPEGAEVRVELAPARGSAPQDVSAVAVVRGHEAFLAGYAAEDEGLYDDVAGR